MQYLVLGGGTSPEKAVSTRSATSVKEALEQLGHTVIYKDPETISIDELIQLAKQTDGVFPILHGAGGEDGTIQAHLERENIPYFGPSPASCQATFNKDHFKKILEMHDIPTPRANLINARQFKTEPLAKQPFVLKPISGGSSIDTFILRTLPYDETPLLEALNRYGTMLIEEFIEGVEITVGVLENRALPVIEIIPPKNQEFDYENKYNGATQELCPPKNVSLELQKKAQMLALETHLATECRHVSRTDILISPSGDMFVIDTNTIPGLTNQSLYPKAGARAGYDWLALVRIFTTLLK